MNDIKEAFNLFLPPNKITVKPSEMVEVFERMGENILQPSIFSMIKSLNTPANNKDGITFQ